MSNRMAIEDLGAFQMCVARFRVNAVFRHYL